MSLDKFYTIPSVAQHYIQIVQNYFDWNWDAIIEPSAGNGSFSLLLPNTCPVFAFDIQPEHNSIIKQDFLEYKPDVPGRYLVIGNPPFGRVSSMAIKFFNHASTFAEVIAFIIPRTFRKTSVQNRLNLNFSLIYDEEIPLNPCAFRPKMNAKCCFQIWVKTERPRTILIHDKSHSDWEFLHINDKNQADFAIRAYGGNCGIIIDTNLHELAPRSYHWIKSYIDKDVLKMRFSNLNYKLSENTARQNSIGKTELVELYKNKYNN